jgi:hypothetical protein
VTPDRAAQTQTLSDIEAKWREDGYTKFKTYAALDSGDALIVGEGKDLQPLAARVNSLGSAKVGKPTSAGMGKPLKPLHRNHPNYEWERQRAKSR